MEQCCQDVDDSVDCIQVDDSCGDIQIEKYMFYTCDVLLGHVTMVNSFMGDFNLALQFPNLCRIEGNVVLEDVPGLTSITARDTSKQIVVASNLEIHGNDNLMTVDLAPFTTIGGALYVADNQEIARVSFPSLARIGPALTPLYDRERWFLNSVNISMNPKLSQVILRSLTSIDGLFTMGSGDNQQVTDISSINQIAYMSIFDNHNGRFLIRSGEEITSDELVARADEIPVCDYILLEHELAFGNFSSNCLMFGDDCRCDLCSHRSVEENSCSCILTQQDTCDCPVNFFSQKVKALVNSKNSTMLILNLM